MFLRWEEHIDRRAGLITYTANYKDDSVLIKATVYPCEHPANRAKKQWTCWANIWTKEERYDNGLCYNETAYSDSASAKNTVQDYIEGLSQIKRVSQINEQFAAWLSQKDDLSEIEPA